MSGPDALSRSILQLHPELAGHVHLVNGRPWCDGVNHTTMCDAAFEAPEATADKDGFLSRPCPECHRTRLPHHSTCAIGALPPAGGPQQ